MWRFDPEMDPGTWKAVDSPASATLYDVVRTAYGPCAVGKRGRVLGRSSDGDWGVVVENGPSARGETLYCAAATDDGAAVAILWKCATAVASSPTSAAAWPWR